MSYTYLLEREGESWEECSSDTPQFALWKLNLTAGKSYSKDNETASCQSSQSGMMSAPSTANLGEEKSMSSVEDSLAKTSQQQEKEPGSQENEADCGEKWPESLAKYDLNTHSWRTHQCLLFEDLTECLAIFPRWGMMHDGELWELPMSAHLTEENESGYWPTPRSCSAMAATITPESAWNENRFPNLETIVGQRMWPTPCASDNRDRGHVGMPAIQRRKEKGKQIGLGQSVSDTSGALNPDWVEWLMGWPIGWTDLKPLEMGKFQSWLQQHGESLEENK